MKCLMYAAAWMLLCPMVIGCSLVRADDPASSEELDAKIRQLRQERVDVLTNAVEIAQGQYRVGLKQIWVVLDAQQQLSNARLELADTNTAQQQVVEQQLKVAQSIVQVAQAKFNQGAARQIEVERAKADALHVEIILHSLRREVASDGAAEWTQKIRQLREERCRVFEQCCDISREHYMSGIMGIDQVDSCIQELLRAQLETADTPEQKRALLKKLLSNVKEFQEIVENRVAAGMITELDLLQARAQVLQVECELAMLDGAGSPGAQVDTKVQELRQRQFAVLAEAADMAQRQYNIGVCPVTTALDVHRQLLTAILAPEKTPAEKLALLDEQAGKAGILAEHAKALQQNGVVTSLDVLDTKSVVLRIEIERSLARRAALVKQMPK